MKTISVIAIASVLLIAPVLLAMNNNAFAQNSVFQGIGQEQLSTQLGLCISGVNTFISCNNLNSQTQTNFGNNVAGQIGGSGSGGGNSATQAIGQAQSSNQGGLCVSGGSTSLSCNNLSFQDQTNFGNNVAGQIGGSGYKGGGNSATQSIGQAQTSNQFALCVSGDDTIGSCNNFNSQKQTNFGNNVAGQIGGSGSGGGNSATQAIGQAQSSNQNALCVSGGSTSGSCNNFNSQTQTNYGNNVIGQTR
jgi:hypothetical protein